jgi:tetratricopeptide (TPR) repeat protein
MRRSTVTIGLLIVLILVGAGVLWQRSRSGLEPRLVQARAAVGTIQGKLIERVAQEFPEDAEAHFLWARQLAYTGKFEQAETCLNKAAALGWPRAQVERQRWIGSAHRDFRKAEPHLLELLDIDANDHEVILALAAGYNHNKLPMRAESLLSRMLQADPDDGAALTLRGETYLLFFAFDRAQIDLEKAYAQSQDRYYHFTAQFLLANCLRQLGQVERALGLYRKCCEEAPADAVVYYNIGLCAHYLGRPEEAMAAFDEVLRLKPNDIEALLQVAYLLDERGELDRSLEVLHKIEVAYPDEPQMLVQMAKTYQAQGKLAEAAKYRKRSEALNRQWEERAVKERQKPKS